MPAFVPRNRVEIIRDMVARAVGRSKLVSLTRNSAVFHVLAAAATEDAEQYFQIARMRGLFSVDTATGSDLDERAAEIQPGTIIRRQPLSATGTVVFSRPGTTGTVLIAAGTLVAASDQEGQIRFRTTTAGTIAAGNTTSPAIAVRAVEAGVRGNVAAAAIVTMVTRIQGITGVTNAAAYTNGRDRESDESFRARIKAFVQALSRGTKAALEAFAREVILTDGKRVLFAKVKEPAVPDGTVELFIDDGAGSAETFSDVFLTSPDTLASSASAGDAQFFTQQKPIRDDGSFVFKVNAVTLTRNTDYTVNTAAGQIDLDPTVYPTGLAGGETVTAEYRYYTGLIQEVQRVIDGDPATPLTHPGVRAAGVIVFTKAPSVQFQDLDATISVLSDFDVTVVQTNVETAIQEYINGLDMGEDVIVSEIINRAMSVEGMFDFNITLLNGATPANQTILENQVARIVAADITLT